MTSQHVSLVTGGGMGLGSAYVDALLAAGGRVAVNDADPELLDAKLAQHDASSEDLVALPGRIGGSGVAEDLVSQTVKAFGQLDFFVANAGPLRDRTLLKMTDEDFDDIVGVHLRGAFLCGRAVAQQMREQGSGSILLISSPAGLKGSVGQTAYASSKAGIIALGRVWAAELSRYGIRVNVLIPTAITRMTRTIPWLSETFERLDAGGELTAQERADGLGWPSDLSGFMTYIGGPQSRHVTGRCFAVGGDRLMEIDQAGPSMTQIRPGGWNESALADQLQDREEERR